MSTRKHQGNKNCPDTRFDRLIANSKPEFTDFFESVLERKKSLAIARESYESRNNKELSIRPGEVFEILDDEGSWWCLRAPSGKTGHVPHNKLEVIPNPVEEDSYNFEPPTKPIVVNVPVVIQPKVQQEEVDSDTSSSSSPPVQKSHKSNRVPTLVAEPVPKLKAEKLKESNKPPEPKSLQKLRKMRAKQQNAAKKVAFSPESSSDSSSSSSYSSSDDSDYENSSRKARSQRKKAATKKTTHRPKPHSPANKHCCDNKITHCCELVNKSRIDDIKHCCETTRFPCQQNAQPPPPSSFGNRYDGGWHNQAYIPTGHPNYNSQAPLMEPAQLQQIPPSAPPAPTQSSTVQAKPPVIILMEPPKDEPTPEPEYEGDIYDGQSVPVQIVISPENQYSTQMNYVNQYPQYAQQQPSVCYPMVVDQTASTTQWPAAPYYMYTQ